jgi:hypothetical protein
MDRGDDAASIAQRVSAIVVGSLIGSSAGRSAVRQMIGRLDNGRRME